MSTANTQLGQAIAKAGAYFQGSKVDRIVAEAKHERADLLIIP